MEDLGKKRMILGHLTVYRERGRFLRMIEQFEKAIATYDLAMENFPEDVRLLVSRAQACIDAVRPLEGLTNAEHALKNEPNNLEAKHMQANAMYTMTDFERSLVLNFRGARYRKKPPYFKEGINQGLQIAEDCVGKNSGNVMLDFLPLIRELEKQKRIAEKQEGPVHISRIPRLEEKKKISQMEARQFSILSRVLAMKYLGSMAYDKFFLQELSENHSIVSANAAGSKELQAIINEALRSLTQSQALLRAQRPYYSIKLAEKAKSKYHNDWNQAVLEKEREVGARQADRLLRQIETSVRSNRTKDVMTQAERMQIFLNKKTPRNLPGKDGYTDRLYKLVGEAYFTQHRLSYTLSERSNRRRIAFLMGLPVGRPKSFDSVMANYPYKFIDVQLATERVAASLEMCENSTMRCWLMYEMARLLCTQKNYSLAKFYGKRCQREAKEIHSPTWWFNGLYALISADMQQFNANEVRVEVEEAYEWTKKMQNPERVQAFLKKCEEIASQAIEADARLEILHREKQILAVLEDQQSVETSLLFKRISNVPAGRRFSVLPSNLAPPDKAERKRRKQRGLTVVPGTEKALPAPPRSAIHGYQAFDI